MNAIVESYFRRTGGEIWPFPFREGVIYGELARGGWGNQGKRGLGEPGGIDTWSLRINEHMKNPSKQSLVRKNRFCSGCEFEVIQPFLNVDAM